MIQVLKICERKLSIVQTIAYSITWQAVENLDIEILLYVSLVRHRLQVRRPYGRPQLSSPNCTTQYA